MSDAKSIHLKKLHFKKREKTVKTVENCIKNLKMKEKAVTLHSIREESKNYGPSIAVSTILRNSEARRLYDSHSSFKKKKTPRRGKPKLTNEQTLIKNLKEKIKELEEENYILREKLISRN